MVSGSRRVRWSAGACGAAAYMLESASLSMRIIYWLLLGLLCWAGPAWAQDQQKPVTRPPEPAAEAPAPAAGSLKQRLDQWAQVEDELAALQRALDTATAQEARRQLKTQISELQTTQEDLLQAIEQLVGPLPPAVRDEPPIALEEQLDAQLQHHEAILESDEESRLPSSD